jgi:microcystin-dependent protein
VADYFLGEIRLFSGEKAPAGWAQCNGQTLPIQGNQALFALLGIQFGGDGKVNFKLPDLRGRTPIGSTQFGRSTGTQYNTGNSGGVEAVALTIAQTPVHNHGLVAQTAAGDSVDPTNGILAAASPDSSGGSAPNLFSAFTPASAVALNPGVIGSAGSGAGHNNMQPFTVLNYCIALTGLYPSPE